MEPHLTPHQGQRVLGNNQNAVKRRSLAGSSVSSRGVIGWGSAKQPPNLDPYRDIPQKADRPLAGKDAQRRARPRSGGGKARPLRPG